MDKFQQLSPKEKHRYYESVATDLLFLADQVERILDPHDVDTIRHYVDHNELGLALDHLLWSMAKSKLLADKDAGEILERLRSQMSPLDKDSEEYFQQIVRQSGG